jgi:hypothetical protein
MHEGPTTNEQILYAQAFQIAVLLKDEKPFFLEGNDLSVDAALETYRDLANSIFRFLRAQGIQ